MTYRAIPSTIRLLALGVLAAALQAAPVAAGDWPTYRGDNARSGIATQPVRLPASLLWTWRSPHPPRPAWPGPAKRDAYNKVENLTPRLQFDRAFFVAAAGGRVAFGSSADDQVRCLDARTGALLWRFFAEAPVRLAPTFHDDALYFGADDGRVYCLDAVTGAQRWSRRPGPADRRVPGNGRMTSIWPVRTGVVVQDGAVYAGAGLFASEGAVIAAFDPRTGEPRWTRDAGEIAPQGYLLASSSSLYLPTGRGTPVVYRREDGERLHELAGSGGTFALLAGETLVHGPGKTGQIDASDATSGDQIARFAGRHMIVRGEQAWLHGDAELSALERGRYLAIVARRKVVDQRRAELAVLVAEASGARAARLQEELEELAREHEELDADARSCVSWRRACGQPYDLILAGDTLFAGGRGEVAAYSAADGAQLWRAPIEGRAFGLAAAGGRLFVSTDEGTIHVFGAE